MLRLLFSHAGRLDRLGYFSLVLLAVLLFLVGPALVAPGVYPDAMRWPSPGVFGKAVVVFSLALWAAAAWIYACATIRRLHDLNLSGWIAILALIPAIGLLSLTVPLLLAPGRQGANRYGAHTPLG